MKISYQYAGLDKPKAVGLQVAECGRRLHRLAYAESRLMFLQAAHIISTPQRDIKALLSRSQYEDGQHADRLKHRRIASRSLPDDLYRPVLRAVGLANVVEAIEGALAMEQLNGVGRSARASLILIWWAIITSSGSSRGSK